MSGVRNRSLARHRARALAAVKLPGEVPLVPLPPHLCSPSCSTSSGPGPQAGSVVAGMPGHDAVDKAKG